MEQTFANTITGTAIVRPKLNLLLSELRPEDVVVVTKYDRLARSLKDLLEIVDLIQARGAGFRSLGEDIDMTSPDEQCKEYLQKGSRGARDRFELEKCPGRQTWSSPSGFDNDKAGPALHEKLKAFLFYKD